MKNGKKTFDKIPIHVGIFFTDFRRIWYEIYREFNNFICFYIIITIIYLIYIV